MDLANVSSALSAVSSYNSSALGSVIGLKMLDNAIELNETMNEGITKMMELSVNPHIGSNFDAFA